MATISEAFAIAIQHHEAGRLNAAEQIYRQILQADPTQPEAYHRLGLIAYQVGQPAAAAEYIERAIRMHGNAPAFYRSLAAALISMHRLPEATDCLRRIRELQPDDPDTLDGLGNAFGEVGALEEAVACLVRALELKPEAAGVHNNLGNAYQRQGKGEQAITCYRRAVELRPDLAEAHNNLGLTLRDQGALDEAIASFLRALELKPDLAEAHHNLGAAFTDQGRLDEAVVCSRRAVQLKPSYADAYSNLGVSLRHMGKAEEALACYNRAVELKPDCAETHNSLIFTQLLCPGFDGRKLYEEQLRWRERHAARFEKRAPPHRNERSIDRRLRIGYVSRDFRRQVVGLNLLPLFREHDHRKFEIICYSDAPRRDDLTDRFRGCADAWRESNGLTDEQLARCIQEDKIDVLIDCGVHTAHNRLLAFARQPAPVQATFAGYPGTTGLSTVAYRLTDPYLDPPGLHDLCYSEESIRLPDSFWCYDPGDCDLEVNALPAVERGSITFGCLNSVCKVNSLVLTIWARIVRGVAHSRLILLAGEGSHRAEISDQLAAHGVSRDRVAFVPVRPRLQHLQRYHVIDLGLDTIPYNGHTTSLDSFWMGVPVVTLVGPTVVGRAGFSQLMNLGLPDLIAHTPEELGEITAKLADDLPRLSGLRATLRRRMQESPLMDAPRFARGVEAAYREMWRRWCAS